MSYRIKIEKDAKNTEMVNLFFEGDFNVQNVETVKDEIISVLKEFKIYVFNLESVENMDFTFLQLLVSVYKYCKSENKKIEWNGFGSENVKNLISKTGFDKIIFN